MMRAPTLPPPAAPKKKRKRRKSLLLSFLGFGFGTAVLIFVAASAAIGVYISQQSKDLPDYESLAKYEPPVMTRIHAHDGSLISEFARERRIFVPINTVPKRVLGAFLSAEDRRFYEHGGIDFQGVGRAVFKAVENKIKGGAKRDQGASTITQQVAKNFLLTNERSIERKVKEAILAIRIERAYSKDKILELYLNEIYLGLNSYGVAAAGLTYFNKELERPDDRRGGLSRGAAEGTEQLSSVQAHGEGDRAARLDHRADGRKRLHHRGRGRGRQEDAADANLRSTGAHISTAEFFAEEVRRSLLTQYGEDKLYGGGLSVRTTLDPTLAADRAPRADRRSRQV